MKAKDLQGADLDYWTARAHNKIKPVLKRGADGQEKCLVMDPVRGFVPYEPSKDSSIAGSPDDLRGVISHKFGAEVPDDIVRV